MAEMPDGATGAVPDHVRMKLHDDEIDIDAGLVSRLVAAQFPQLSELSVSEVPSTGTVNAIYRIGDDLCARLPRVERWAHASGEGMHMAAAPGTRPDASGARTRLEGPADG